MAKKFTVGITENYFDYAKAIKAADGDVSKMPHYNFDVTIDPNIPASK